MSNKMLIDASHPEETRVVVTKGNRIEEFDFESEHKKQLKSNIYLARVTRVEPSLQAAFVEYGGNRHGFLAFSEIHPDYYQIPVADRQALLEAEEKSAREDEAAETDAVSVGAEDEKSGKERKRGKSRRRKTAKAAAHDDFAADEDGRSDDADEDGREDEKPVDLGAEDALEEVPARIANWRDYKIQEVIKRRQILLVQIVKEERGTKGAALSTYLSLAGRYSVLMPNTARGGGISRKITNAADRKRLKDIVKGLSVPRGMGVILRTAGAARTKTEVRRDYEYLMRLWENVRSLTLTSIAPALVYEEGSLIKRSIRDLYNKDIDEVSVSGERAYREAKDFMRMLMPSHAKFVQPYREPTPIFSRRGIEAQLDGMLQPEVGLKAGGYLVINQTEALVAIDVNSGRSTREHSVEETALQTNLEAAEEVARQLRLRDLAGLVVIDFIDMQEKRNIRAVEKRLKDCLRDDRARIQVGHISHFGLMEMSRQRIRASVLESTTKPCPHCFGTGYVRSQSSLALHVLRMIEEYLQHSSSHNIMVRTPVSTALYVLNNKRRALSALEERFGLVIDIEADDTIGKEHLAIHKTSESVAKTDKDSAEEQRPLSASEDFERDAAAEAAAAEEDFAAEAEKNESAPPKAAKSRHKTERRSAGGKAGADTKEADAPQRPEQSGQNSQNAKADDEQKRRRRRGRRGGRRNREHSAERIAPAAEPVGAFAAQFMLESESASNHGENPADSAEPVGAFAAAALTELQSASTSEQNGAEKQRPASRRRGSKNGRNRVKPASAASGSISQNLASAPQTEQTSAQAENTARDSAAAESSLPQQQKSRDVMQDEPRPAAEPVLTSSASAEEKTDKVKKKGWWRPRGKSFL